MAFCHCFWFPRTGGDEDLEEETGEEAGKYGKLKRPRGEAPCTSLHKWGTHHSFTGIRRDTE